MGTKRISDEELLDDLHRVADEVGRPPTKIEYDDHGEYSYRSLELRFGDTGERGRWNGVLLTAEMEPRSPGRPTNKQETTTAPSG